MVRIEQIHVQGVGAWNEDSLLVHEAASLYGVIDGVSSLVPYRGANDETGGYLASQLLQRFFAGLEQVDDLRRHVELANEQLRQAMERVQIDTTQKEGLWGAALALVKLTDTGIEFAQTGDCMIFAVYEGGEVRVLTRSQVSHLEERGFAVWRQGIANGIGTRAELIETVQDILKDNRYHANTPDGYGVLNGEPSATDYVEYGRINRARVTHLVLATDGLFHLSASWEEMVQQILDKGLAPYTAHLMELEESDPECLRYIRYKKSDDKGGLVLHLK